MSFIHNIKLAQKLPIVMIGLTATAILISGWISHINASEALQIEAEEMLEAVAEARSLEFEAWIETVDAEVRGQAESPTILSALRGFVGAWDALEGDKKEYLQKAYITENTNAVGEKHLLDYADDGSAYSQIHKIYHPLFRKIIETKGYYDVFLTDTQGNIVYSVFKEVDYATNLKDGEFSNSGLGSLVQRTLVAQDFTVLFEDFKTYAPSDGNAAAFMGAPIIDRNGVTRGSIVFQLPAERIDRIMTRTTGLGQTGDTYFVGEDLFLRSNPIHSDGDVIIKEQVLYESAKRALAGETGLLRESGENPLSGDSYENLAAFRYVDFHGVRWGLVAEQKMEEILLPVNSLGQKMMLKGAIMIAIVALISYLLARAISTPLTKVGNAMHAVSAGDYSLAIPSTSRGDEIGGIAKALDDFRITLGRAESATRDGLFKGAAFEGSSAALMMVDQNFDVIYMNGAANTLMADNQEKFQTVSDDFDAAKIVGQHINLFHEDPNFFPRLLSNTEAMPVAFDMKVDGSYFALDVNSVSDAEGVQIGCVLEWKNVTEMRANEVMVSALDESQSKAEFNLDGTLLTSNIKFSAMMDMSPDDLIGLNRAKIFRFDEDFASERGAVWSRLKEGESIHGRFTLLSGSGEEMILDGIFSPVKDASGKPFRIILLGTDITISARALIAAERSQQQMKDAQDRVVDGLKRSLKRLADGDLTSQIEEEFSPEYEDLRNDFNLAMANLLAAMKNVVENAGMIRGEAEEISNAADDLSRRTEKQAATLEETATALDQLTSSVRSAADGADQASIMVANAKSNAETSGEVVQEAIQAMSEIERSSNQISKIISVIDDIAFQTNLLALNAGVEAARAGEAGRGFAVVASEVRALAQRSSEAAREINDLISQSGAHVKRGVGLVGDTGDALKGIVFSVSEIARNVSDIAVSSREQSSGLAEINVAVNQLDQVTQQNAAMFEQTTAASHALTREAENLTVVTSRFSTLSKDDNTNVVRAEFVPSEQDFEALEKPSSDRILMNSEPAAPQSLNDDWEDF